MLTQCSYKVFQQHKKLPDTLSFDRPVYLLPKAELKGMAKCQKSQHKKCRYPLNKGFTCLCADFVISNYYETNVALTTYRCGVD